MENNLCHFPVSGRSLKEDLFGVLLLLFSMLFYMYIPRQCQEQHTGSLLDLTHVQFEDRVLPTGSNISAEKISRNSQGLYFTVNLQMFAE